MLLHKQLEFERKKKGISVEGLSKIIEITTGLAFHLDTIRYWEDVEPIL